MIRRQNAPVKIPPAPPSTGQMDMTTCKPRMIQVGPPDPVPVVLAGPRTAAVPPKPQRKAKQQVPEQRHDSTLSNVALKFSFSGEAGGRFMSSNFTENKGEDQEEESLYENISKISAVKRISESNTPVVLEGNTPVVLEANAPVVLEGNAPAVSISTCKTDSKPTNTVELSRKWGTYEVPIESAVPTEKVLKQAVKRTLSKSAPTSPQTGSRSGAGNMSSIYKDPVSLFETDQDPQPSNVWRKALSNPLQERSGSECSTLSAGSVCATILNSSAYSGTTGAPDNTLDEFVAIRRNQIKRTPNTIPKRRLSDDPGMLEMFMKSMFGGSINPTTSESSDPNTQVRPRSIFYVSTEAEEDQIYHTIGTDSEMTGKSKFYIEKDHIYSTIETLGPLDYPVVAVSNPGYRDRKVTEVEEIETSIPVYTDNVAITDNNRHQSSVDSFYEACSDASSVSGSPYQGVSRINSMYHPPDQPETVNPSGKRKLTRVSLMRKQADESVTKRDKPVTARAKEIVSMRFSSDGFRVDESTGNT